MNRTDEFYRIVESSNRGKKVEKSSHVYTPLEKKTANLLKTLTGKSAVLELSVLQGIQKDFRKLVDVPDRPIHEQVILEFLRDNIKQATSTAQLNAIKVQKRQEAMESFFKPKVNAAPVEAPVTKPLKITPEEQEKFERAQSTLQITLSTDVDALKDASKTVEVIGSMMNVMSEKIIEQQEMTEGLLKQAHESTEHMKKAEKQLTKAKEHSESYKFYVMLWFIISSIILLVLDFMF